jgi:hypothetical protein
MPSDLGIRRHPFERGIIIEHGAGERRFRRQAIIDVDHHRIEFRRQGLAERGHVARAARDHATAMDVENGRPARCGRLRADDLDRDIGRPGQARDRLQRNSRRGRIEEGRGAHEARIAGSVSRVGGGNVWRAHPRAASRSSGSNSRKGSAASWASARPAQARCAKARPHGKTRPQTGRAEKQISAVELQARLPRQNRSIAQQVWNSKQVRP